LQNAVIEPFVCGWTDDSSDIDRYHVEVYYMNIGGTGDLEETGSALYTEDIRPPHNSFRFTCQTSGVYSIQLTVFDRANNSARARQLFNYDGVSKITSRPTATSIMNVRYILKPKYTRIQMFDLLEMWAYTYVLTH